MLYSGLLTLFSSYPRTHRQKDCRSLSSSTLSWFTWVCAGYFLFSLWVRISLPTGAASPPETVRCSLLFSVFAHLAIKRFKSICPFFFYQRGWVVMAVRRLFLEDTFFFFFFLPERMGGVAYQGPNQTNQDSIEAWLKHEEPNSTRQQQEDINQTPSPSEYSLQQDKESG